MSHFAIFILFLAACSDDCSNARKAEVVSEPAHQSTLFMHFDYENGGISLSPIPNGIPVN